MKINQYYPTGNNSIPFITSDDDNQTGAKLNEDQYEVYLNGNFVGHKTLKTQGERLTDVDDFLRNQGIQDFSSSIDGDHYKIETNGSEPRIHDVLSVYFNNR